MFSFNLIKNPVSSTVVVSPVPQRNNSIDIARGICMFLVMLYHSECYFPTSIHIQPFFAPFFLTTFFFITGRYIVKETAPLSFLRKLKRIFATLVWPYLIFTTLVWLPKAFAHGNDMTIKSMLYDVLGGTASWFVAALIVCEILFYIFYKLFRNEYILLICGLSLLILGTYLKRVDPAPSFWYYKEAFVNLIFVCLGYIWSLHYNVIQKTLSGKYSLLAFTSLYIALFAIFRYTPVSEYDGITIDSFKSLVLSGGGIVFILKLSEFIRNQPVLEYIGRNSILYYFLNGGVILILSKILNKINTPHYYVIDFLIAVIATAVITVLVWIINRYLPFFKRFPWENNRSLHFAKKG